MALEVEVHYSGYEKGVELSIPGIVGTIKNGSTVTLDDEAEDFFKATNGKTVREAFKGMDGIKVKSSSSHKEAN